MSQRENMILMEAREYAIYLIRMCLSFQNNSFPDNYDVQGWESRARSLNLTYDDCFEISSSNVLNCSHTLNGNEYGVNFLSVLQSLCASIKPSPTYYPYWIIVAVISFLSIIACLNRKRLSPSK